ncbi:YcnI family copper-binding membrane protein [Nakamurella leprariae]|uniref:YcnI family protein n=1 Tax=Nakamurella leprariae TaxID=2803911 RepID=A0A938YFT1_9ACTN|nr:YcnI family protein [Nakamurella leprariae]MBM9469099.1 YcnI family protein [Nakamurella leprariae]
MPATAAAMLLGSGLAAAHVTVNPSSATAGSYSTLTFRVPNESATAATTALTVEFPTDTPFASVRYQPVPGWTAEVVREPLPAPVTQGTVTIDEAVTSITWTADAGTSIGQDQFGQFTVSVGPVPDVESISFPASQVYDDGSVVDWDEVAAADAEEPEHPAPTLTVQPAAADTDGAHVHGATAGGTSSSSTAPPTSAANDLTVTAAQTPASDDGTARTLGAIGIALAAVAVLLAAVGVRTARARR